MNYLLQRFLEILMVIGIATSISGCKSNCNDIDSVKAELNSRLSVGDARSVIDQFLSGTNWNASYDKYKNRYQGTIRGKDCGPFVAISVYLYLNTSQEFSHFEVFESYTMP